MTNNHGTLKDLFEAIANAIRTKTGSTDKIVADNFPTEILNISDGGSAEVIEITGINVDGVTLNYYDDKMNLVSVVPDTRIIAIQASLGLVFISGDSSEPYIEGNGEYYSGTDKNEYTFIIRFKENGGSFDLD